jgi:glycosyltransferase involved in cell wall biosynthesis
MKGRPQLSAVIITLDAEHQLEACLESLHFVDEIVIVDAGSRDNTKQLAERFGARFESHEWSGFGAQKHHAVKLASNDWVLCLDADERVPSQLAEKILAVLQAPQTTAYEVARSNFFLGAYLRHGEGYPDWSLRLFDRRGAQWSDDAVHEKVIAQGAIARIHGAALLHHSADDLNTYMEKQNRYTSLQAATLHSRGVPPSILRMLISPLLRFIKFYFIRAGFLDGRAGLIHISIGCFNSFIKYAKLFALKRTGP